MNKTIISIVMPLYNAATFLKFAIHCALSQTYKNLELLCVDDASSDETADIVSRFMRNDARVRYIKNEERKGAAYSRNVGLMQAKGEYIFFWDGDDYFDSELCERALNKAIEAQADVVLYDCRHIDSEDIGNRISCFHDRYYIERYCDGNYVLSDMNSIEWLGQIPIAPWNKIYKKDFLIRENIFFQSLPSSNDVFFSEMAMVLAGRITNLYTGRYMLQVRDHNSGSRISASREPKHAFLAYEKIARELSARGLMERYFEWFFIRFFRNISSQIVRLKEKKKTEVFFLFLREEGIPKLISEYENYYDRCSDYIKRMLNSFLGQRQVFEDYYSIYGIDVYFEKRSDEFKEACTKWKKSGKNIALWGLGKRGRFTAQKSHGIGIDYDVLIDKNKDVQGTMLYGTAIVAPADGLDLADVFIFSTYAVLTECYEMISSFDDSKELVYLMEI